MKKKIKIFCVNLFERDDKYNYIKNQLDKFSKKIPIEIIRNYKHVKGGRYGCFDSHIKCVKKALEEELDYCICLEDDVFLYDDFILKIKKCIKIIESNKYDIDIIYSHEYATVYLDKKINNEFYRGKFLGTCCILLTKKFMKKIIEKYKYFIDNYHYDYFLSSITSNSYSFINYMVTIKNFTSDNDVWSKNNVLITFSQNLCNFTTSHLYYHNLLIINTSITLIHYNPKLLKKFMKISSDFYEKNLK
jgi:GR25 family glycosyltransferase involved in LPS biosynthesis